MIGLATSALMAAVWQGILLAVVVWLGLHLLPKTPAAVRFAIWFGVFLVVTALPMATLWPHTADASKSTGTPWLTLDARWSLAIAAVWLVASLVRAGTLAQAALRVRALWKRATPVDLAFAAEPAVGSRRARLCTSDEIDRPTVIGFFSPKILIPGWLLEKLTPAELEQIVLHETGHLGRADDWMNLLQKIALVVFPLNPALAWVERRLCFERELAVDERVLRSFAGKAGAATAYAACLTNLAEHRLGRRGLALALGALGRESELGRRVRRILRRGDAMKPLHARLVLGGAMLGLLVGAVGLERCPQIVGFASGNGPRVARADQRSPARGDAAVLVEARSVKVRAPLSVNGMRPSLNVPHESLLLAREPIDPENTQSPEPKPKTVARVAAGTVRMVQTSADSRSRGRTTKAISDVEPSQPATGAMEWLVVTSSWQGADGSRMVLTTARSSGLPKELSDAPASTGDAPELEQRPQASSDEVHPYAAVPVRGGWLILKL
jgi:beta-lactamase regulating signal transducer with metallopeptidase domain